MTELTREQVFRRGEVFTILFCCGVFCTALSMLTMDKTLTGWSFGFTMIMALALLYYTNKL